MRFRLAFYYLNIISAVRIIGHDSIDLSTVNDNDPSLMHIQALCDVILTHEGQELVGRGVVEQLFIGPHAPSGLHGLFDPA
jgi:hypothetical protein